MALHGQQRIVLAKGRIPGLFEEPVYPAKLWPLTGSQAGAGSESGTVQFSPLVGWVRRCAGPKAAAAAHRPGPCGRDASKTLQSKPRTFRAQSLNTLEHHRYLNIGEYLFRSTNRKALVPKYWHQLVTYLYRAT